MKQNPCRYCALAYEYKGKKHSGYKEECIMCKKRIEHEKYLKSKRKFIEGDTITNLDELFSQEWVMWYHKTKHIKVFENMSVKVVNQFIKSGAFRVAIRKEREVSE
jgi:hypothetical protein